MTKQETTGGYAHEENWPIEAMRKYAKGILDYRQKHNRGPSMKDRVLSHYLDLTEDANKKTAIGCEAP